MVTKVSRNMLEHSVAQDMSMTGDTLNIVCTDGTVVALNLAQMPALAVIPSMVAQLATINAYIAAHP